jgi:hypothetical protein
VLDLKYKDFLRKKCSNLFRNNTNVFKAGESGEVIVDMFLNQGNGRGSRFPCFGGGYSAVLKVQVPTTWGSSEDDPLFELGDGTGGFDNVNLSRFMMQKTFYMSWTGYFND